MTTEQTRQFHCRACDHRWEVPFGGGRQMVCPKCGKRNIIRTNPEIITPCQGKGFGKYRNRRK